MQTKTDHRFSALAMMFLILEEPALFEKLQEKIDANAKRILASFDERILIPELRAFAHEFEAQLEQLYDFVEPYALRDRYNHCLLYCHVPENWRVSYNTDSPVQFEVLDGNDELLAAVYGPPESPIERLATARILAGGAQMYRALDQAEPELQKLLKMARIMGSEKAAAVLTELLTAHANVSGHDFYEVEFNDL